MAYTLKTDPFGAGSTPSMMIAVNPDTSAIVDFASSAVTADMVIGANVTVGSQAWDGNTRDYWSLGSGTTAADFIAFGANKPAWSNNVSGTQRTIVFIGEVAGISARVFGKDSSNYFASRNTLNSDPNYPFWLGMGNTAAVTGGQALPSSGDKTIFGFSSIHSTSATAYWAAHDAASMSSAGVTAPANTSATPNYSLGYVGRHDGSTTHQQDKVHAIIIFPYALSEANWDSLRDDWRGALLESGASAVAAIAGRHYARMRVG